MALPERSSDEGDDPPGVAADERHAKRLRTAAKATRIVHIVWECVEANCGGRRGT